MTGFFFNEYMGLNMMLNLFLRERGFEIVTTWDSVDGFSFLGKDAHDMRNSFVELGRSPSLEPSGRNVRPSSRGGNPSSLTAPAEAFATLRTVLQNNKVATAVIINYADLMAEESDGRLQPEDRDAVLRLHKALSESAYLATPALAYRNLVVMIAKDIGKVPPWIYANSADVDVVTINAPSKKERVHFLNNFMDDQSFYNASSLTTIGRQRVIDQIGDATDGFTIRDLNALGATSIREQLAIDPENISALVNYYKNGIQNDPWKEMSKETVKNAPEFLRKRVLGQEYAISAVQQVLMRAQTGITASNKANSQEPKGILFL